MGADTPPGYARLSNRMATGWNPKSVLVTGATGRLGAIVGLLLARGHRVRATTRVPTSDAARRLRAQGAEVVPGDFDDLPSIRAAAAGVDALFATGTAHRAGPGGEIRHGRTIADAAAEAGVPHLVYCSGDGVAEDSPLPLLRGKFEVEQHIRGLGVPHTILAPTYFMENVFNPWNLPALRAGMYPSPIPVDRVLQQTAIADLIAFAALVIERPSDFLGERVAVASDELSGDAAAAALSRVLSRDIHAEQVAIGRLAPPLRALFAWLERTGHTVDIEALRRRHPEVGWHRYEDWARLQASRFADHCPHPPAFAH
jgi:uncharacterized protein YbjT (DUF2867 family)